MVHRGAGEVSLKQPYLQNERQSADRPLLRKAAAPSGLAGGSGDDAPTLRAVAAAAAAAAARIHNRPLSE